MRGKRTLTLFGTIIAAASANAWGATQDPTELLARARQALGLDSHAKGIVTLVSTGEFTKVGDSRAPSPKTGEMAPADSIGKIRLTFRLPDAFRQDYAYTVLGKLPGPIFITCRDGDTIWLDNRLPQPMPTGTSISVDPPPEPDAGRRRSILFLHARYLLALILYTTPSFPIAFTYAGSTGTSDSRGVALDGRGPQGFEARLVLDQKTFRPLMLSYAESGITRELRLDGYENSSGILFPHQVTLMQGGNVKEVLRLKKFELNSQVPSQDFHK